MLFITGRKILFLGVIASIFVLSSCSKSGKQANYIPENAAMVAVFDVGSMKDKSTDWTQIMKFLRGDVDDMTKKILNSGVDLDSKGFIFLHTGADAHSTYVGSLLKITDEEKFIATLKGEAPNLSVEESEGIKTLFSANVADGVFGLKDGVAIALIPTSRITTLEDLKSGIKTVVANGDAGKNLQASNAHFKGFMGSVKDISVWSHVAKLQQYAEEEMGPIGMESMASDLGLDSTYSTAHIEFNTGEIVATTELNGNENLAQTLSIFHKGNKTELAKKLPVFKPISTFGLSLNFDGIVNLLKSQPMGMEGANMMLGGSGLQSVENVTNTFTGDIVAAVCEPDPQVFTIPNVALGIGLKDPARLRPFLDLMAQTGNLGIAQDKSYTLPMNQFGNLNCKLTEDALLVTGPEKFTDQCRMGTGEVLEGGFLTQLGSGAMSLDVHFDKIPPFLMELSSEAGPSMKELERFTADFNVEGSTLKAKAVLSLKNKDVNSLNVLMQLMNQMPGSPGPV